jgi:hypothetical protein
MLFLSKKGRKIMAKFKKCGIFALILFLIIGVCSATQMMTLHSTEKKLSEADFQLLKKPMENVKKTLFELLIISPLDSKQEIYNRMEKANTALKEFERKIHEMFKKKPTPKKTKPKTTPKVKLTKPKAEPKKTEPKPITPTVTPTPKPKETKSKKEPKKAEPKPITPTVTPAPKPEKPKEEPKKVEPKPVTPTVTPTPKPEKPKEEPKKAEPKPEKPVTPTSAPSTTDTSFDTGTADFGTETTESFGFENTDLGF